MKSKITEVVESLGFVCPQFVHQKNLEVHQMIEGPIVAEVRRHRKEHAEEHGNDLKRIVEALRRRERESKRSLVDPGPKIRLNKTQPNEANTAGAKNRAVD